MVVQPALRGDQAAEAKAQPATFLQQVGALKQHQSLLTASLGLMQGPHLVHQRIPAAADQIKRQSSDLRVTTQMNIALHDDAGRLEVKPLDRCH